MRDKIAEILPPFQDGYIEAELVADEIIAALPDMVVPLVWKYPIGRNYGELLADAGIDGCLYSIRERGTVFEVVLRSSHLIAGIAREGSMDAAKAAAQAHRVAQALSAFGITPPSTREDT